MSHYEGARAGKNRKGVLRADGVSFWRWIEVWLHKIVNVLNATELCAF